MPSAVKERLKATDLSLKKDPQRKSGKAYFSIRCKLHQQFLLSCYLTYGPIPFHFQIKKKKLKNKTRLHSDYFKTPSLETSRPQYLQTAAAPVAHREARCQTRGSVYECCGDALRLPPNWRRHVGRRDREMAANPHVQACGR